LSAEEKNVVAQATAAQPNSEGTMPTANVFADTRIWSLGFIYACLCMGLYGIGFWLPQLLKNAGAGDALHIGFSAAVPYGIAVPIIGWIARRSDASGQRCRYFVICTSCASAGFALSALRGDTLPIALAAMTLATVGIFSAIPLFSTIPIGRLGRSSYAASGIALVNSLGALGGFISPYLVGAVLDATHSTAGGLLTLAAFVALSGAWLAALQRERRQLVQSPEKVVTQEAAFAQAPEMNA